MIGQQFVLDQSCGAWYIEGVNLKPGKPFQMTVKLMNNKIISGFIDGGQCHPVQAKTTAAAVPGTSAVATAKLEEKPAEKTATKSDDKKGK